MNFGTSLQLGLLGYPLGHSASPRCFGEAFERAKVAAAYDRFEYQAYPGLENLARQNPRLLGLNITLPHKKTAFLEFQGRLDNKTRFELTPEAAGCGAVNCIGFRRVGSRDVLGEGLEAVVGHNTDVEGFTKALDSLCTEGAPGPALVLGNGGVAAAVGFVFEQRKIPYQIVTRTLSQKPRAPELLWEQVNRKILADHPLLVQCTPLGMAPHPTNRPPLNLEGLGQGHLVMDLIYNPLETLFLEECRAKGALVMGGMPMFQAQAEASLRFWSNLPGGQILQNDRIQLVF